MPFSSFCRSRCASPKRRWATLAAYRDRQEHRCDEIVVTGLGAIIRLRRSQRQRLVPTLDGQAGRSERRKGPVIEAMASSCFSRSIKKMAEERCRKSRSAWNRELTAQPANQRTASRAKWALITGASSGLGLCREPAPITPYYAPFLTFKMAGVCGSFGRRNGSMAACRPFPARRQGLSHRPPRACRVRQSDRD